MSVNLRSSCRASFFFAYSRTSFGLIISTYYATSAATRRPAASQAGTAGLRCVAVVGRLQPVFHFGVNLARRRNRDAVRDAVLLGVAAGVDQSPFNGARSQREAEIDACVGCGLDLREHVVAAKRHDGLARTSLHLLAQAQTEPAEF